jgi:hypothetical protein
MSAQHKLILNKSEITTPAYLGLFTVEHHSRLLSPLPRFARKN